MSRATKFLENSKKVVLFFLLKLIYKIFSSDSCCIVFLVILSSSRKLFVNFKARKHLVSNFEHQSFSTVAGPTRHPHHPAFPAPPRPRTEQLGRRHPLAGADWPAWPPAAAPRPHVRLPLDFKARAGLQTLAPLPFFSILTAATSIAAAGRRRNPPPPASPSSIPRVGSI